MTIENVLLVAGFGLMLTAAAILIWSANGGSRRKTEPSTGKTRTVTDTSRSDDLNERLRVIEVEIKSLQMEWADTYSKMNRIAGRMSKTAAIDNPEAKTLPFTGSRHDLLVRNRKEG